MAGGRSTTLILNPKGKTAITLPVTQSAASDYLVNLGSINAHEDDRMRVVYASSADGGRPVGENSSLVPFGFDVIIIADTVAARQSAYDTLMQAVCNERGGTIKFKPDGVGASVLDTYYHYVKSPPPRKITNPRNRWDAAAESGGKYIVRVAVVLHTQPIATSDPDSPTTLSDMGDTLENWDYATDSQYNYLTIDDADVKGSLPAVLRVKARPGAGQFLGRMILFKRHEGTLANFKSVYEAEDANAIYPSVAWTTIHKDGRGGDQYMRCLPPSADNTVAQGLRFIIADSDDHEGRFAMFGVGYDDADTEGVWTHQTKVKVGNVTQTGDKYKSSILHSWSLIYCGEFELPPTEMSDVETGYHEGPYVEWYSTRASGTSEFRLDAIILVYVADSDGLPTALDVVCDDVNVDYDALAGVSYAEKLLIENYPGDHGLLTELSHVVAQSDDDLKRICAAKPRGDFITLDPTKDTRLLVVQEEASGETILDDDFEGYKGSRWIPIAEFETDETWTLQAGSDPAATTGADTDNEVEGSQGRYITTGASTSNLGVILRSDELDLENEGRFDDGDFSTHVLYLASLTNLEKIYSGFATGDLTNYYYIGLDPGDVSVGQNFITEKKSNHLVQGSPDWGDIDSQFIRLDADMPTSLTGKWDYWRIEKADPDDANNPNATGSQWNLQPTGGRWTITEDMASAGATLACLDIESGVEKTAIIDEHTPDDVQFRARCYAKRDAGYVGLVWRSGNDTLTEGTEDCYAALLDIDNDQLITREYAAGATTDHDTSAFTCAVDAWYVVGVIVKGDTFKIYATAASNLTDDDDVFSSTYLIATVTDTTRASGKCGVMSISTLGRFDDVKLVNLRDKVVPANTATLEGQAIFRTIAPFSE